MVTCTTKPQTSMMMMEAAVENRLNISKVCMRLLTTDWMAMTDAPGRASPIWATISSMGRPNTGPPPHHGPPAPACSARPERTAGW